MRASTVAIELRGHRRDISRQRQELVLATLLRSDNGAKAARSLGIGHQTFRNYLSGFYHELGVSGRMAHVKAARILGWLRIPS